MNAEKTTNLPRSGLPPESSRQRRLRIRRYKANRVFKAMS